tara:strand:- start:5007 stop:5228 length:222 start_codon:yes stop_codon:yes gene_type:complete
MSEFKEGNDNQEEQQKYVQNLVNILQKNCNEYFAQNIQLEAKVKLLEEQIETLTKENVKLKSKEITRKKKEDK